MTDTPESHGRSVDVDNKSLILIAAADHMESWPRQTTLISAALQLHRSQEIFALCRNAYPEYSTLPPLPGALHKQSGTDTPGSSSSAGGLPATYQQPRTHSRHNQAPARTPTVLPISESTQHATTASSAALACTGDQHGRREWCVQALGWGAWGASGSGWYDRDWTDWQEAWHGWTVHEPKDFIGRNVIAAAAFPAVSAGFSRWIRRCR